VTDSSNDYSQSIKTHFYSVMMLQVNQRHTVTETAPCLNKKQAKSDNFWHKDDKQSEII